MDSKIKIQKYNNWMRNVIKSIHYSNNEKMLNSYEKLKNDEKMDL